SPMSANDRKTFFAALNPILGPVLRAQGFIGSGTNYQRYRDPIIQVLKIQGSRHGDGCFVNLGVHLQFLPTSVDKPVDQKKISEPECEFRIRLARVGE